MSTISNIYTDFYGLKKSPFNITSDPDIFFESSTHKEALALLMYGVQEKKGIMLITGEVGTGKTTLSKIFLNILSPSVKTSLILNPYFSNRQLLQAIIEDFGLKTEGKTRLDLLKKLDFFLIENSLKQGNAVLVIDEAQNLTRKQLEQIRLLSNLETSKEKLLQIVLVGQPELNQKLKDQKLRQINQRIIVRHNLSPLKRGEVEKYIEFRLTSAGDRKIKILKESYDLIYSFSKGIPRLINILCDRVMLYGFAREKKIFDREIFKKCIEELK